MGKIRGVRIGQVWHDEMNRYETTGRLDEGPCWCEDCIAQELELKNDNSINL